MSQEQKDFVASSLSRTKELLTNLYQALIESDENVRSLLLQEYAVKLPPVFYMHICSLLQKHQLLTRFPSARPALNRKNFDAEIVLFLALYSHQDDNNIIQENPDKSLIKESLEIYEQIPEFAVKRKYLFDNLEKPVETIPKFSASWNFLSSTGANNHLNFDQVNQDLIKLTATLNQSKETENLSVFPNISRHAFSFAALMAGLMVGGVVSVGAETTEGVLGLSGVPGLTVNLIARISHNRFVFAGYSKLDGESSADIHVFVAEYEPGAALETFKILNAGKVANLSYENVRSAIPSQIKILNDTRFIIGGQTVQQNDTVTSQVFLASFDVDLNRHWDQLLQPSDQADLPDLVQLAVNENQLAALLKLSNKRSAVFILDASTGVISRSKEFLLPFNCISGQQQWYMSANNGSAMILAAFDGQLQTIQTSAISNLPEISDIAPLNIWVDSNGIPAVFALNKGNSGLYLVKFENSQARVFSDTSIANQGSVQSFHFPDFNANDPDQVSASFILSSASVSVNGIIKLDLNPSESGQFVSQPIYLRSNPEFPDIQDGLDTEVRNSSALEPGNPAPLLVALSKGARQAALMIGDSECNLLPTVIPPFNGKDLGIYSLTTSNIEGSPPSFFITNATSFRLTASLKPNPLCPLPTTKAPGLPGSNAGNLSAGEITVIVFSVGGVVAILAGLFYFIYRYFDRKNDRLADKAVSLSASENTKRLEEGGNIKPLTTPKGTQPGGIFPDGPILLTQTVKTNEGELLPEGWSSPSGAARGVISIRSFDVDQFQIPIDQIFSKEEAGQLENLYGIPMGRYRDTSYYQPKEEHAGNFSRLFIARRKDEVSKEEKRVARKKKKVSGKAQFFAAKVTGTFEAVTDPAKIEDLARKQNDSKEEAAIYKKIKSSRNPEQDNYILETMDSYVITLDTYPLFIIIAQLCSANLREAFDVIEGDSANKLILSAQAIYQLTVALEFLSKLRCVHLDLHSGNILIDENGKIRLADFGCARELTEEGKIPFNPDKSKAIPFGRSTMAPEVKQFLSGNKEISVAQADIFSVGALFYALWFNISVSALYKPDFDAYQQAINKTFQKIPNFVSYQLMEDSLKEIFDQHFKVLLQEMLIVDPNKRISLEELKGRAQEFLQAMYLYSNSSRNKQRKKRRDTVLEEDLKPSVEEQLEKSFHPKTLNILRRRVKGAVSPLRFTVPQRRAEGVDGIYYHNEGENVSLVSAKSVEEDDNKDYGPYYQNQGSSVNQELKQSSQQARLQNSSPLDDATEEMDILRSLGL